VKGGYDKMEKNVSQEKEAKEAQPKTEDTVEKEKKEFPIDTEVSPLIPETRSMVERAEAAGKEFRETLNEMRLERQKMEAIAARMMLSGRAEAGSQFKTPEQEEKEKVEAEVSKSLNRFK